MATLHNVNRTKESDKIWTPEDFMGERKELTADELAEKAKWIYKMFGGING